MSIRTRNLANLFRDVKTRTIILFTGALLLIGITIGVVGLRRSARITTEATVTTQVPKGISKVPLSSTTTRRYEQLQRQANIRAAQKATREGKTALPVLVGQLKKRDPSSTDAVGVTGTPSTSQVSRFGVTQTKGVTRTGAPQTIGDTQAKATARKLTQQELRMQQLRKQQQQTQLANQQRAAQARSAQVKQQEQQKYTSSMQSVAQALFKAWNTTPKQQLQMGQTEKEVAAEQAKQDSATGKGASAQAANVMIKAGSVVFAVLDTAINSDQPGPVMATIVQGKFKGAKLLGSFTRADKRVVIKFNTMSLPKYPRSIAINSFAIDGNTARTALATGVNSHYFLRYGALFASAFVQGYGEAASQPDLDVRSNPDGGFTIDGGKRTGKESVGAGLAKLGQQWGTALGQIYNRPPTVTVASGTGVGILFMRDVDEPTQ